MEFNDDEFNMLTGKLEGYAAKVSALEARLEMKEKETMMQEEMNDIKEKLRVAHDELAGVRQQLAESEARRIEAEKDRENLQGEYNKLQKVVDTAAVENAFLKNCILISLSSIRQFSHLIKRVELRALIHTFLMKTLSPLMGTRGIEAVNEAVEIGDSYDLEKLADQLVIGNEGQVTHE